MGKDYMIELPKSSSAMSVLKDSTIEIFDHKLIVQGKLVLEEESILQFTATSSTHGTIEVTDLILNGTPRIVLMADDSSYFSDKKGRLLVVSETDFGETSSNIPETSYGGEYFLSYVKTKDEKYAISITPSLSQPGDNSNPVGSGDTGSTDTEPIDTEPIDTEPIDAEPIDTDPIPIDILPVDTEDPNTIDLLQKLIENNENYISIIDLRDNLSQNLGDDDYHPVLDTLKSYFANLKDLY
jgi:hypothetical protein